MDVTYRFAWKEGDTALYMDASDCKYAAKNGNLAWRINNPGLIKHHCCKHYRDEFEKISNFTVIDSESMWEHSFNNESYQVVVHAIIEKYRKSPAKVALIDSKNSFVESFA